MENQIDKAAQAINSMMQKKINDGDVLLTFGWWVKKLFKLSLIICNLIKCIDFVLQ